MLDHARTVAAPETEIHLKCPACGYQWNVASVLSGVWWGRGVTPSAIAALCWCPYCHAAPPMEPAPVPPPRPPVKWPYCLECGRAISLRDAALAALCETCREA